MKLSKVICVMHICVFVSVYAGKFPGDLQFAAIAEEDSSSDESCITPTSGEQPPSGPIDPVHMPAAKRGTLSDGLGSSPRKQRGSRQGSLSSVRERGSVNSQEQSRNNAVSPRGASSEQRSSVMVSSVAPRDSEKTDIVFARDDGAAIAQKEVEWAARERVMKDKETELHNRELQLERRKDIALAGLIVKTAQEDPRGLAELIVKHIPRGKLSAVMLPILEAVTTEPGPDKRQRILTSEEMAVCVELYYKCGLVASKSYLRGTHSKQNDQSVDMASAEFIHPRDLLRVMSGQGSNTLPPTPFTQMSEEKPRKKWKWC